MVQLAATGAFAGARVVMKDRVHKGSELCPLFITSLMAHNGTVPAEEDWLRLAGFAPKQIAKPGFVAFGKFAVHLVTSGIRRPAKVWACVDDAQFVNGAQYVAPV